MGSTQARVAGKKINEIPRSWKSLKSIVGQTVQSVRQLLLSSSHHRAWLAGDIPKAQCQFLLAKSMFATIVPRVFVIIQVYKRSGCLVLSSTVECSRVLSNAVESCRGLVLSNAVGCCRVLSSAAECCRILSSAFEYCRVLSRAVAYVPCSSGFGLLKWSGAGGAWRVCVDHMARTVSLAPRKR